MSKIKILLQQRDAVLALSILILIVGIDASFYAFSRQKFIFVPHLAPLSSPLVANPAVPVSSPVALPESIEAMPFFNGNDSSTP